MASLLIIFNLSFSLSLVLHLLTPSCTAPIALSSASMASPWRRRWFSMCRVERGGEGEKDDAFVFFFSPLLSRLKVKKRRESIDQKKEIRSIAPFSLSLSSSLSVFLLHVRVVVVVVGLRAAAAGAARRPARRSGRGGACLEESRKRMRRKKVTAMLASAFLGRCRPPLSASVLHKAG
jgi:hypothetical protein